jgi:hypothetical protein
MEERMPVFEENKAANIQHINQLKDYFLRKYREHYEEGRLPDFDQFLSLYAASDDQPIQGYSDVTFGEVKRENSSITEKFAQAAEILSMLFQNDQEVEPKEDMFFTTDEHGNRIPKFSHFSWESFSTHTSWRSIVSHVVATPLTVARNSAYIISRKKQT